MATKESSQELTAEQLLKSKKEAIAQREKAMTKEVYNKTVQQNEKNVFHVRLDKKQFSAKDGSKLSVAFVQKFPKAEFAQFQKHASALGYTEVEVLWNPEIDYKAELDAIEAKREADKKEAIKIAEKATADALKAAELKK